MCLANFSARRSHAGGLISRTISQDLFLLVLVGARLSHVSQNMMVASTHRAGAAVILATGDVRVFFFF